MGLESRLNERSKNLIRAKRYAKGAFGEEFNEICREIDRILNQRIAEADAQDAETQKRIKKEYEDFLEKEEQLTEEKSKKAQEKREADYLTTCEKQEKAKSSDDFRSAAEDFEKIGAYKDCTDRAKTCRKKEEEQRTEEERLQREAYLRSERLRKQKNKKIAIIASAAAVIAIAAIFVNDKIIQPSLKYKEAQSLLAEGNYADAYLILDELRGYKDVDELLETSDLKYLIGREVIFGSYEQDGNTGNGAEDIEWIILARTGDNALLLSKYGLDTKRYNEGYGDVTWGQSDIRSWLNGSFMDTAFTVRSREPF